MMSTRPWWTTSRMISRNSGKLRWPYSARVHISGEKCAGRSPRPDRYDLGPGARTPKAMSASLASARMKARDEGFALASASLASSDFMKSDLHLRQGFFERTGGLLQSHLLFRPQLNFQVSLDALARNHRRDAEANVIDAISFLHQG